MGAIPVSEQVVVDGNMVTGAGVTSGIDFALGLPPSSTARRWRARSSCRSNMIPAPPFDSGSPRTAAPETVAAVKARLAKLGAERRALAERVGRKLANS